MNIAEILKTAGTIAFVGCSRDPNKDAHIVPKYMKEHGYKIIPVNPGAPEILGEKCYPSISSVPESIDILDIFRPSSEVMGIVKEAIKMKNKPKVIWAQLGIEDNEAKHLAEDNDITFVQNMCIMREHMKRASGL